MSFRFINRNQELQFLEDRYSEDRFQFIILHGRRRVGKTELLRKFMQSKRGAFTIADQTTSTRLYTRLSHEISFQIDGYQQSFLTTDDLFQYIFLKSGNERLVVILDEFQYILEVDPTFISVLQRWIDQKFKNSKLMIILCGSEIRMMNELFAYTNPLYGRHTGNWKLEPVDFITSKEFFTKLHFNELFNIRAVYGGMPAYLIQYDENMSFNQNIEVLILEKGKPLSEEPMNLLRQELREVKNYFAIIQSISEGQTRLVHIANVTGIEARSLPKYLGTLISIDILEKVYPVGVTKPRTRLVQYSIKDNFIRFWFRFVFNNRELVEFNKKQVLLDIIKDQWPKYLGKILEKECIELLRQANRQQLLFDTFSEIGLWWEKGEEIDIVGISKSSGIGLFVECKISNKVNGKNEIKALKEKIERTRWKNTEMKKIGIVAMGFTDNVEGCIRFETIWEAVLKGKKITELLDF